MSSLTNEEALRFFDNFESSDRDTLNLKRSMINQLTHDQWIYLLKFSDLAFCPYTEFEKVIKDS